MQIKRVISEEECKICDELLSCLNNYEAKYDEFLSSNFKYEGVHQRSLGKDNVYIALAVDKEPIGYVFAYLKSVKGKVFSTNVIEIEALFIREEYRNKGTGKKLIESVEKWSKDNFDDYIIELHAINNNINAIDFYKHLGFKEVRTIFRK